MATPLAPNVEMVRDLQESAARALPAEQVEYVDGWWLRRTPGSAWWAGTVLPHGDAAPDELMRRVVTAEDFYARENVPARFQITPGVCAAGLDALLAERGYRRENPMSLQVASTARVLAANAPATVSVRVDGRPTRGWFAVWHAEHGNGGDPGPEWDLLALAPRPSAYASATIGGEVVAVGRSVADDGWAGVFGMATSPRARRRGAAGGVLGALAAWAGAHGADRMYLQVGHDNVPALRLYQRAGFAEVCGYHYRIQAPDRS